MDLYVYNNLFKKHFKTNSSDQYRTFPMSILSFHFLHLNDKIDIWIVKYDIA